MLIELLAGANLWQTHIHITMVGPMGGVAQTKVRLIDCCLLRGAGLCHGSSNRSAYMCYIKCWPIFHPQ